MSSAEQYWFEPVCRANEAKSSDGTFAFSARASPALPTRSLPSEPVAATTGLRSRSSTFGTRVAATSALTLTPARTTGQVNRSRLGARRIGSSTSSAESAASPVATPNASSAVDKGPLSITERSATMTGQCQRYVPYEIRPR